MVKEMIKTLNDAMFDKTIDFKVVEELLKSISIVTGKDYGILNRRVVFSDPYDNEFHDAWVWEKN